MTNMSYLVQSSEQLRKKASDTETKALLYLMNFREDSDEIHYFVKDYLLKEVRFFQVVKKQNFI